MLTLENDLDLVVALLGLLKEDFVEQQNNDAYARNSPYIDGVISGIERSIKVVTRLRESNYPNGVDNEQA